MQARTALVVTLAALAAVSCKKGFGSGFEGSITMHVHSEAGDSDMVIETKSDKMRFHAGEGTSYMLYDPGSSKVTMVNDATKTYSEIDFARPGGPKANTSPDTARIDKSGKHETVAGVDCERWTVHDGGKRSEVCIAQGIAFFDMGSLKSGHGAGGLAKELRDKKLFPLRDVEYDASGKELSRMEVTKVEKKTISDAELSVPKGYAKIALPGM
jgi:hypothetical protein